METNEKGRGLEKMNKNMMSIVCGIIIVCITLVAPAVAQPTPFVICGYVFDSGSNPCNGSTVQITNQDTSMSKYADNSSISHYYQLVLANGTDLNASEVLRVKVTNPDGDQSKVIEFMITENEVGIGGRLNYNITLSVSNQQTWYFTNDTATGPTWSATYNRNMTKGVEGGDDKVTLAKGERVWFYADQLAECNVSFPAGVWNVSYWVNATNATDSGKTITTRIHGINSTGFRLSTATGYKSGSSTVQTPGSLEEVIESLDVDAPGFTIPEGGRFAIEVLWQGTANGSLEVYCNPPEKDSGRVTSPTSDPGYPIPELPTILLFGLGLLVITGYVRWLRRRD